MRRLASLLDHGPVGGALRRFFIACLRKRINRGRFRNRKIKHARGASRAGSIAISALRPHMFDFVDTKEAPWRYMAK